MSSLLRVRSSTDCMHHTYRWTHTSISPELLKTDGLYPFQCRLFTLMVWDLTFTVCECESSWLYPVRYLRAGRQTLYCLPLSTLHFLLSGSLTHRGYTGTGQNSWNTWADNNPATANKPLERVREVLTQLYAHVKGHHLWFSCVTCSL